MKRVRFLRALLFPVMLLAGLSLPAGAHAHTTVQGVGDLMNGALHPVTTASHVLILLGLGLALGQQRPVPFNLVFRVFAPLSAITLLLTLTDFLPAIPQPALICVALGAATLVALEMHLKPTATSVLLGLAAICIGLDSAAADLPAVTALKTMLGTWLGLQILLLNIAYYASIAVANDRKWIHIGLRVIGSWIIAISLLVLAFALRAYPAKG